jgi:hypothetical protein
MHDRFNRNAIMTQSWHNHDTIIFCYNTIVFSHTPIITKNKNDHYQHQMKITSKKLSFSIHKWSFQSQRNHITIILCYCTILFSHSQIIMRKPKWSLSASNEHSQWENDLFESEEDHRQSIYDRFNHNAIITQSFYAIKTIVFSESLIIKIKQIDQYPQWIIIFNKKPIIIIT